ncbi:MAG: nitroreductase family protein [Desulfobacteraceae bacterium]|nr:nitroreductase family protein [Desulfobacteraceae bacterium]
MSFFELVESNRSCRRFDHSVKLDKDMLKELVVLARLCASGGNVQPLKYILCSDEKKNAEIFLCLKWAAYLKDWKGPEPSERPTGYITILGDKSIATNFWCDHGIAAQTMLLGARDKGFAGCIFAAINHPNLKKVLSIDGNFDILLVIAIGKPIEEIKIEKVDTDGDIKYFRDEALVHHVPKRGLNELIISSY